MRRPPLLAALGLAVACSAGPPVRYYTLSLPSAPAVAKSGVDRPRLGVVPLRVEPPYDQSRLVYRVGRESPEVSFYAYHQWASPLGRDLAHAVAAHFARRLDGNVVELAAAGRDYAATLHGRVLHLEEVDDGGRVEVRLRIELELRHASGKTIFIGQAEGREEAAATSVGEVVLMMRRALAAALDSVSPSILSALADDG